MHGRRRPLQTGIPALMAARAPGKSICRQRCLSAPAGLPAGAPSCRACAAPLAAPAGRCCPVRPGVHRNQLIDLSVENRDQKAREGCFCRGV
eukprot:956802-Pelagomonas_calceolata.AAC.4